MFEKAKCLWLPYMHEIYKNDGMSKSDSDIVLGLQKRIAIQGRRPDMHFEIAVIDNTPIGIAMFAIDLGTVYGLLEHPGYGTIISFISNRNIAEWVMEEVF